MASRSSIDPAGHRIIRDDFSGDLIIVQSVLADQPRVLLLQQPEVHLHPKAQASLGSLFAAFVQTTKDSNTFVIETHSDYLIDRIRQEVAQGSLSPDDVSILFLEMKNAITRIHSIGLDSDGNILKAPPSYRHFFLQEELNLLSRTAS